MFRPVPQDHPSARLGHSHDLSETPQHRADAATLG